MKTFYATILVESDEEQQEFQTDLGRNNISIKVCSPESLLIESGEIRVIHYVLFGDDAGYSYLQSIIRIAAEEDLDKKPGTYLIESIEEGHE